MFLRARGGTTPDDGLALGVANADGSGVRVLSPYVQGLDWQDRSPDSTRIAFLSRPTGPSGPGVINVVNVDGTGLRTLDVGRPAHDVSWLPPDGKEIIFRGEQLVDTDPPAGIFAVRPDGTGLREVSTRPPVDSYDFQSIAVSPDGTRLAFRASGGVFRIHIWICRPAPKGRCPIRQVRPPRSTRSFHRTAAVSCTSVGSVTR
jgi:Tol biopolymer transport system component